MTWFRTILTTALGGAAALGASTPAAAQDRWDWQGGRPGDREYPLVGAGVPMLLPELRRTNRGRAFVMRNFDFNDDARINRREADAANRAFIAVAGPRRDRFDWDRRDVVVIETPAPRDWDRRGMRDYRMRQTSEGATLVLEDVLFATDRADLRPGAEARLRPLASYLRAEPGVRVKIDGHTDSRASDAYNQDLSERRAATVRDTLDAMGVTDARFRVLGHGEKLPVATNATPAGRQRNRRVEVTLLGQRADRFSRLD